MKNILRIFILVSMGLFLNSCYYDSFPQDIDDGGGGEIPDVVSYEKDIMPLWVGECVACHPTLAPPDLTPENSYNSLLNGFVEAGDSESSSLYIISYPWSWCFAYADLPNNIWPKSQTDLVKAWIDQGALDN